LFRILVRKKINIVWFKKDFRLQDHAPLAEAIKQDLPILFISFFEPHLMAQPDSDERHWRFIFQSINDIKTALAIHHIPFYDFHADAVPSFELLIAHFDIEYIFSHQEIGNAASFVRDKELKTLFKNTPITWKEFPTNGIIRGLKNRKTWSINWMETMTADISSIELTTIQPVEINKVLFPLIEALPLPQNIKTPNNNFQPGGFMACHQYLHSFFNNRKVNYAKHISKPTESRRSCSRISPYLTYGNISMRQLFQASIIAKKQTGDKRNIDFFMTRLHWHCHFIQKFESECRMEFENANHGFDLLHKEVNDDFVQAWKAGQTGIPLIDACMHAVIATGYLNFRMRSMLVSFLTHHLFQPWQVGAIHLAKQFLDYEPGIHYPQFQMQAGTVGVNTIRIYNPVKQSMDHDPEGLFIKKWLPVLQNVPISFIHEPWKMNEMDQQLCGVIIGKDYPAPIVDLASAGAFARKNLWAAKKSKAVKEDNQRILAKHTKRKTEKEEPLRLPFVD
jgi:deoxyribodipyrimidine photo-lyase